MEEKNKFDGILEETRKSDSERLCLIMKAFIVSLLITALLFICFGPSPCSGDMLIRGKVLGKEKQKNVEFIKKIQKRNHLLSYKKVKSISGKKGVKKCRIKKRRR